MIKTKTIYIILFGTFRNLFAVNLAIALNMVDIDLYIYVYIILHLLYIYENDVLNVQQYTHLNSLLMYLNLWDRESHFQCRALDDYPNKGRSILWFMAIDTAWAI